MPVHSNKTKSYIINTFLAEGNNMLIEMININLYNKNINGYEIIIIKVNLYLNSASHSRSTKMLMASKKFPGSSSRLFCTYANMP